MPLDKSETSHAILDQKSRKIKAAKIITAIEDVVGDLKDKKVLDIGTGAGYISSFIGGESKFVTSVDIVDERRVKSGYKFTMVKDENLPFKAGTFDVVIGNHVIEHVPNQQKLIEEAYRVLKPGGIMYLATPNKYWLTDPHYRLYFISWLPNFMSKKYLKLAKNKVWDINPISQRGLKKITGSKFKTDQVVLGMIKNPKKYHLDNFKILHPILEKIPERILSLTTFFTPTIIIILKKS